MIPALANRRLLAAALALGLAAGACATLGRPYAGRYRVPSQPDARSEALEVARLLAARLGVRVAVAEEGAEDVFVVLRSREAAGPDAVTATVEWVTDDPDRYAVVVRSRLGGETPEVEAVRRQVEEVLRSRGGRWSFEAGEGT